MYTAIAVDGGRRERRDGAGIEKSAVVRSAVRVARSTTIGADQLGLTGLVVGLHGGFRVLAHEPDRSEQTEQYDSQTGERRGGGTAAAKRGAEKLPTSLRCIKSKVCYNRVLRLRSSGDFLFLHLLDFLDLRWFRSATLQFTESPVGFQSNENHRELVGGSREISTGAVVSTGSESITGTASRKKICKSQIISNLSHRHGHAQVSHRCP